MGPDVWGEGRGKGNKKKQNSWANPWSDGGSNNGGNQWTDGGSNMGGNQWGGPNDGGSNGGNQERF